MPHEAKHFILNKVDRAATAPMYRFGEVEHELEEWADEIEARGGVVVGLGSVSLMYEINGSTDSTDALIGLAQLPETLDK